MSLALHCTIAARYLCITFIFVVSEHSGRVGGGFEGSGDGGERVINRKGSRRGWPGASGGSISLDHFILALQSFMEEQPHEGYVVTRQDKNALYCTLLTRVMFTHKCLVSSYDRGYPFFFALRDSLFWDENDCSCKQVKRFHVRIGKQETKRQQT